MPGGILGTLAVVLKANTAKFQSSMKGVSAALLANQASFKKVAFAATAASAAMAGAIAGLVKLQSDQRSSELKLAAAIRGTGKAIDPEVIKRYAGALQQVTQFGDEATIASAAMLTTFQLSQKQIIGLLPRVQNLAALYGMDLRQAAIQVGKALTAGAGTLGRYGITLSNVEKELFKTGTQTQKVAVLMQVLDKNTGPAARMLADTAVGAFTMLQNAAGDLGEELGKVVEAPVTDAIKQLLALVQKVTLWFGSLDDETKKLIGALALGTTALLGVVGALAGAVSVLPFVIAGFKTLAAVGAVLSGALLIPLLKLGLILAAVAAAVLTVTATINILKAAWEKNFLGIRKGVEAVAGFYVGIWKAAFGWVAKAWGGLMGVVKRAAVFLQTAFSKALKWLADKFRSAFSFIGTGMIKAFGFATGKSADEIDAMVAAMKATFVDFDLGGSIAESLQFAKPAIDALGDTVKSVFSKVGSAVKGTVQDGIDVAKTGLGDLEKDVEGIFAAVKALLPEIPELPGLPAVPGAPGAPGAPGRPAGAGVGLGAGPAVGAVEAGDAGLAAATAAHMAFWEKTDAAAELQEELADVLEAFIGSLGQVGQLVLQLRDAFQVSASVGFAQLGMKVLLSTKGFQRLVGMLDKVFQKLTDVLNPMVEAAVSLLTPLLALVTIILEFLTPAVTMLRVALQVVGKVLWGVAQIAAWIFNGIAKVWNAIVGAIQRILRKIGEFEIFGKRPFGKLAEWADSMEKAKISLISLDDAMKDMRGTVENDTNPGMERAGEESDTLGDNLQEVNETMANVPEGFKVALERFNAIATQEGEAAAFQPAAPGEAAGGPLTGGGVFIEQVIVQGVSDLEGMVVSIQEQAEFEALVNTGGSFAGAGAISVSAPPGSPFGEVS